MKHSVELKCCGCLKEKQPHDCFCVVNSTGYFFLPGAIVPWKNKVVQTCVCVFLKMNEISLSLQVKQWTVFIGGDKILALKWKLEFLEHLSPPPFPPIKEVLFCVILVVTNVLMILVVLKGVTLWKICITQATSIFPSECSMILQIYVWVKIHSKCRISLVAQGLRLHASTVLGTGLIPGQWTESCLLQL